MSCEQPVCGSRVSAIKTQFESLKGPESLEISAETVVPFRYHNVNNNNKPPVPKKKSFVGLQRSTTSIELLNRANEQKRFFDRKSLGIPVKSNTNPSLLCTQKPVIVGAEPKKSTCVKPLQLPLLPASVHQCEVKLSRHTSDPVKRSSIKRSPAFRVGEKQNKAVLAKQVLSDETTVNTANKPTTKPANLSSFLVQKCASDLERLQQPGMTDSIRAALRRPLPIGPPPKKPPRSFYLAADDELPDDDESSSLPPPLPDSSPPPLTDNDINDRIKFLENNLLLKTTSNSKAETKSKQQPHLQMQKSKTDLQLFGNSTRYLLNCLICNKNAPANIYDCVTPDIGSTTVKECRSPVGQDNSSIVVLRRFSNCIQPKSTGHEPIYMEPFSHLKNRCKGDRDKPLRKAEDNTRCSKIEEEDSHNESQQKSTDSAPEFSRNNEKEKSQVSGPVCKCPEQHTESSEIDLHYLCTAIGGEDSVDESESSNADGNFSLDKTYDEITILVDAAFQQKSRSKATNANCSSSSSTNTMGNRSSDGSEGKLSARLSRTLTEKRKDYVRRIAVMPQNHPQQQQQPDSDHQRKIQQKYATLHRTFKSPVIKTFSLEEDNIDSCSNNGLKSNDNKLLLLPGRKDDKMNNDDSSNTDSNNDDEIDDDNGRGDDGVLIPTTSDRIKKYKKIIGEKNTIVMNNNINNNNSTSTNGNHKANGKTSNCIKMRSKRSSGEKSVPTSEQQQHSESSQDCEEDDICDADIGTEQNPNLPKLFQVCLLVGFDMNTNTAYLKSKYPTNEPVPDQIEQLVFPSRELVRSGKENQDYCLILTDDQAFKIYGYCRRVLPENSDISLPLCYCVISVTKALGFYQKLLQEIESRHGQTESQMNFLFRNLQRAVIPPAGKYLHIKLPLFARSNTIFSSSQKVSPKRLSLDANPKWLTESASQAAFSTCVHQTLDDCNTNSDGGGGGGGGSTNGKRSGKSLLQEFEEKKQHQQQQQPAHPFDYLINRSLIMKDPRFDEIFIRRPSDLRLENTELSELLKCLGPELLIDVFSNLLLERKVILYSSNISLLSKSVLALQTILYPFQWQYTIVTILPQNLVEICQAPFPVLAGILEEIPFDIEDGTVVNLDSKRIVQTCGDEQTIIPDSLRKSLQLSLEMVDLIDKGKILSSVLISEAFLRFFIELFGDYRKNYFHKEEFIQVHQSQHIRFFLEWFLETSMFRNYVENRFANNINNEAAPLNGLPPDSAQLSDAYGVFYNLFDARLMERSKNTSKTIQNIETIVKNSKIINKNKKSLKMRLKALFD